MMVSILIYLIVSAAISYYVGTASIRDEIAGTGSRLEAVPTADEKKFIPQKKKTDLVIL